MRRQSADVATNLPGMTNREDLPTTIAVPVELLDRAARNLPFGQTRDEVAALLPNSKPRLVAVTHEQWIDEDITFDEQPDLLTLLDEAMESVTERWTVNYTDSRSLSSDLKARIRTALGVTE